MIAATDQLIEVPPANNAEELDALEAALPGILRATGPVFIDLKIVPGETYPQDWAYMHGTASRETDKLAGELMAKAFCPQTPTGDATGTSAAPPPPGCPARPSPTRTP